MTTIEDRVFQVRIVASPEAAWTAITDPMQTKRWYFSSEVRSTWQVGAPVEWSCVESSQTLVRLQNRW